MTDEISLPLDEASELAEALVEALYEGDVLCVLSNCSQQTEAFDFLARMLQEEWLYAAPSPAEKSQIAESLGTIIDWFKDLSPDSPVLWYWRMIHAWMTESYERFIALDAERGTIPPILFARYYPDEISDYRIRSLIRLGHVDEALQEAKRRGNHSDWYLMTVYAVNNQPGKAIPLLNRYLEQDGYSVYDEWIRGNPDLWDALQRPDYAEWLKSAIDRVGMSYDEWKAKRQHATFTEAEEITGLDLQARSDNAEQCDAPK